MSKDFPKSSQNEVEQKHPQSVCTFCKNVINPEAVKCPKCGSFQNWRKNINLSTTLVSLLIALISVTGIVVPILWQALTPSRSQVSVEHAFVTDNFAYLYLANSGSRPALIETIKLRIGNYIVGFPPNRIGQTDDQRVVLPLETAILRLDRQSVIDNDFAIGLHPLELEAYGDTYHQWAFYVEGGKISSIAQMPDWPTYEIPKEGLNA